ncbi:MAG: phosphoadenosine phosphosulfate sulfotransferase, partial [Slackia isoflavoniconvertens]|nr:phosphoadenosine phosphosulfate sulfotransferase [Slackia isoflavoniconvertens]
MADIELRFHKDMLVLSAPLAFALANQGVDMETEAEYMSLVEPETMRDALRLESMAGAQCLVAETDICEARLAHKRM